MLGDKGKLVVNILHVYSPISRMPYMHFTCVRVWFESLLIVVGGRSAHLMFGKTRFCKYLNRWGWYDIHCHNNLWLLQ